MGQAIAKAINDIDGSTDAENQERDILNSLYALGQTRIQAAFQQATSNQNNVYAPIKIVLLQRQSIVVSASTDTNAIVQGIQDAVGNFIHGQILDGVTDIIANGLNVVLGESAGQERSSYTYALIATEIGALLRLDIDIYSFQITSQGLQTKVKDMTAVSTVISSIDTTALSLATLRGIVSLSFGNSSADDQAAILQVVQAAWNLDNNKQNGGKVTDVDKADYRSLFRDSRRKRQATIPTSSALSISPKVTKANRLSLLDILHNREGGNDEWSDVLLWLHTSGPVDEEWLRRLESMLSGFNVEKCFRVVEPKGPISGSAITILCQINSNPKLLYDQGLSYMTGTIFPALQGAGYLSVNIRNLALQYEHPGGGSAGEATSILYKMNQVTNKSADTISFFAEEQSQIILTLQPNSSGIVNGLVSYISSTAGSGPSPPPSGPSPAPAPAADLWVTYQDIKPEQMIHTMPITVDPSTTKGYVLSLYGPNDKTFSIMYNSPWSP